MLSFLKVRVIVNDKEIYQLVNGEPVVIPLQQDNPNIVITDGYHFTKPLKLTYKKPGYFNFDVVCAVSDFQLLGGLLVLSMLYMFGFLTNIFFLKLISFTPIIYLLFYYYINRHRFLRVTRVKR